MTGSIVWLASYPKSGNTWMRAMLTALLDPEQRLANLDAMIGGSEVGERQFLDDCCGVDSSSLPYEALKPWLCAMRLGAAAQVEAPYFVKTHDVFGYTADGQPLFPAAASRLVVHIVRHPCDVAVSLAAHDGSDLDAAIRKLANPGYMLNGAPHEGSEFLPVMVGDWSGHTLGWLEQAEIPAILLRYEDMIDDPAGALATVAAASGLQKDRIAIREAAAAAGFERLRAAERESGFAERPAGMASFFRSGRAGGWRDRLDPGQAKSIASAHKAAMGRLGYEI